MALNILALRCQWRFRLALWYLQGGTPFHLLAAVQSGALSAPKPLVAGSSPAQPTTLKPRGTRINKGWNPLLALRLPMGLNLWQSG